jgi:uncharacterized protein YdhG (YjbR/CyaY superfamily)
MQSDAATVKEYLSELPDSRKDAIRTIRQIVLEHLPEGYEEVMNWGMITYQVPLEIYPDTYNRKPLMYAALASQKNHMALYLTGIYMSDEKRQEFEATYKSTGKPFDVGKSCVRFKKIEDLPLPLIGKVIASMGVDEFVAQVKEIRSKQKSRTA